MRSRKTLALAILVGGIGLFVLRDRSATTSSGSGDAGTAPGAESLGAAGSPEPPAESEASRTHVEEASARELVPQILRGVVLEDLFGTPLAARVEPDAGAGLVSDLETGAFELEVAQLQLADARTLRVSALGFEDERVELDLHLDEMPLEIRLKAKRTASVLVQYEDGSAAARIPVTWRAAIDDLTRRQATEWIEAPAVERGRAVRMETDPLGLCELHLPTPALAVIEEARGAWRKLVRVLPGEHILVVVPERAVSLRFVDAATLAPLESLELEAWSPRETRSMATGFRTDRDGRASIAGTSFPILVRLAGSQVWQRELIPLSDAVFRCGFGGDVETMIRIEQHALGDPLLVGVRACAGRIRLLDAESGAPVDAPVRLDTRAIGEVEGDEAQPSARTVQSPRFGSDELQILHAHDGLMDLPCWLERSEEWIRGTVPGFALVIAAAGYLPLEIGASSAVSNENDSIPTFRLRRAPQRRLRIVHEDGRPFTGAVSIYSPELDLVCYGRSGTRDGLHGPFDWGGGPLTVSSHGRGKWRVPAEALSEAEVAHLTVPSDTGAIVVERIPASAAAVMLFAKRGIDGEEYPPSAIDSGSCRFEHLPQGSYLVGPRSWIRGAEMQSVTFDLGGEPTPHSIRTPVKRGETSTVRWMDCWSAGRALQGRVRISGPGRLEPFLVPYYAPGDEGAGDASGDPPRLFFGRTSPRIALDREGRYSISADDPLPRLIAVCLADETNCWGGGELHVIEVLEPGESAEVETATVELSLVGSPPDASLRVEYDLPLESLRHPLFTFHAKSASRWLPGTILRLEGIPLHVRELFVQGRRLPVELRGGESQRIAVDLAALPLTQRP